MATEDIKDLMNLLSGISQKDVFVFGTFLGVPEPRLRDIEMNHSDNHQRQLTEVYIIPHHNSHPTHTSYMCKYLP